MNFIIPKRIIQFRCIKGTSNNAELPPLSRAVVANIKLLNPDFEYQFFDDIRMESFVRENFPEHWDLFCAFRFPIQRFDFFRYLAIYDQGGFYFDLDVLLSSSLADLLKSGCVFPFERLTWSRHMREQLGMDWETSNYAFGAAPQHPFIGAVIQNCVRAQTDRAWMMEPLRGLPWPLREELEVIYSTGPGLISRTFAEYDRHGDAPVRILFPSDVCDKKRCWNLFGNYGIHLGEGSWRARHGSIKRRWLNYLGKRNEAQAIRWSKKLGPTRTVGEE